MAVEKKPAAKPAAKAAKAKGKLISSLYEVGSDLKRKNKSCPKCGKGTFLANHKDRLTCGKCGYMEKK